MLLGGAQIVPFAQIPKKSWTDGMEKKPRLEVDLRSESDLDDEYSESEFYSESSYSSDDESDYGSDFDLEEHIQSLLPGAVVDGVKSTQQANTAHLEDLRPKKVRNNRLVKRVVAVYKFFSELRRRERERRKHYLLREMEERVKQFDELKKQQIQERLVAHYKEVMLEAHRRRERIKKNSRKKADQKAIIMNFTRQLEKRDVENKLINFYTKNLSTWAIEGMDRRDAEKEERLRQQQIVTAAAAAVAIEAEKQRGIEEDAALLEEDKRITADVQTMMIQYGIVAFETKEELSANEKVDEIFSRAKNAKRRTTAAAAIDAVDDTATHLRLTLKHKVNLIDMKKRLKKDAHRRVPDATIGTPFRQDLSGTGQITSLKAVAIGETGALSFAAELIRGACPMLQQLDLKNCEVKSAGVARLFVALKAANLLTLRVLNLRANHVTAEGLEYVREVCSSATVFMNLCVLNLAENELGDEGVDSLIRLIIDGHLLSIQYIDLQRNAITDIGFVKIVNVMKSLKDTKCPELVRMRMENNLITGRAKRKYAPYPKFLSF